MATITATAAQSVNPPVYYEKGPVTRVVSHTVSTALSAGDVVQMLRVPSGCTVVDLKLKTDLFGGGNATMIVGDGNDTDRYLGSTSTSASLAAVVSILPTGFGYTYTADDTIDIVFATVTSASAVGVVTLAVTYTNTP